MCDYAVGWEEGRGFGTFWLCGQARRERKERGEGGVEDRYALVVDSCWYVERDGGRSSLLVRSGLVP